MLNFVLRAVAVRASCGFIVSRAGARSSTGASLGAEFSTIMLDHADKHESTGLFPALLDHFSRNLRRGMPHTKG